VSSGDGDREDPVDPDLDPRSAAPARMAAVLAAIAVGGIVGAEARYGVGLAIPHDTGQWPWATLLINASGCLLIGVLMVVLLELTRPHPLLRPLLGVGVLGGYTTFSTYAVDSLSLVQADRPELAAGYVLLTPLLALAAVAVGVTATRTVAGDRR
jgi:CrcB protein